MKLRKKWGWIVLAVLVLIACVGLIEKEIYKSSIFSLPLFNSDGSVTAAGVHTAEQKIYITFQGQETEFRGVNADFMTYLIYGDRRMLFSAPEVSGECVSVRTDKLSMEIWFGEGKEMFVHYRYGKMPAVWYRLSGYGSYEAFMERALGRMTELNDMPLD